MADDKTDIAKVLEVLEKRRLIYTNKAGKADPFGPDTDTAHERYTFAAEAMEHAIYEIRGLNVGGQT